MLTLQKDTYVSLIEQKSGITDSDYGNVLVDKIYIDDDFMIGGGRSFQIPDAYDSAWGSKCWRNGEGLCMDR